jgi:hypothetical protein
MVMVLALPTPIMGHLMLGIVSTVSGSSGARLDRGSVCNRDPDRRHITLGRVFMKATIDAAVFGLVPVPAPPASYASMRSCDHWSATTVDIAAKPFGGKQRIAHPVHLTLCVIRSGREREHVARISTILRRWGSAIRRAALPLALLSILAFAAPVACAQGTSGADLASDKLIISRMPEQGTRPHRLLSRMLARGKKRLLGLTHSEVWSVRRSHSKRLTAKLQKLGINVTILGKDWNHILRRHKIAVALTPAQQAVVDKNTRSPETVNFSVLEMPDAAVTEHAMTRTEETTDSRAAQGDRYARVVLPISEGKDVTLVRTRPTVNTGGGLTWRGEVEETGERAVLMQWKDGHLSGYFAYKGHVFTVNHMGGEIHALAEIDPGKLPPDHAQGTQDQSAGRAHRDNSAALSPNQLTPVTPAPKVSRLPDAQRRALEAKVIVIDIMLLYTKNVGTHYVGDPGDGLALAIEEANETFRNSGLGNISLRLVHSQAIDYDEAGTDQFNVLYQMVDGVGPFKDLKHLRNDKRADIVGLIIDDPKGCGLSTRVGADAEEAFFVVHHACAATTMSIAHEVGHILGARHDRVVDANNTPFAYGHGFVNGTKWRTMMGYNEGCGGCPRIPYWSNPRIMYKGEPTGTAASDDARVILEQAERVSKFR